MRSSFVIALAVLPGVLSATDGVVNKDVLTRQLVRTENKIQRGFKAFKQNKGFSHPLDRKKIGKRDVGKGDLTNADEALWYGIISVGTPPTDFTVDFDTGSSDLFLPGANCRVNCDGHKIYDTSFSSTAQDKRDTFALAFGDGSVVEGEVFSDTVAFADLIATDQAVGAATQYSDGFAIDQFPPDGLLGMGFPEISEFKENPNSKGILGNRVDGVNVSGKTPVGPVHAIVDTGTALLLGDEKGVKAVYDAIPGSKDASDTAGPGFFTVPCNSISNVSLTLGSEPFPISADTFNLGQVAEGSSDCVGGLASADTPDGLWVLGDVFLQNVYTVFDVEKEQVGFATPASDAVDIQI
ncbi:hypothetical protein PM082_005210 [Marasmius tenuissimus]|nr:hypothetical protein PM082_005210 [Marasmius tenuissimus]